MPDQEVWFDFEINANALKMSRAMKMNIVTSDKFHRISDSQNKRFLFGIALLSPIRGHFRLGFFFVYLGSVNGID